ncbi:hypothetical protein L218DRAFT_1006808 [Marasmius fiardii PR-910]|nr:hypothetical protein L218DRAFT_1006808 [Marasmius fiardii PR-910]
MKPATVNGYTFGPILFEDNYFIQIFSLDFSAAQQSLSLLKKWMYEKVNAHCGFLHQTSGEFPDYVSVCHSEVPKPPVIQSNSGYPAATSVVLAFSSGSSHEMSNLLLLK